MSITSSTKILSLLTILMIIITTLNQPIIMIFLCNFQDQLSVKELK